MTNKPSDIIFKKANDLSNLCNRWPTEFDYIRAIIQYLDEIHERINKLEENVKNPIN